MIIIQLAGGLGNQMQQYALYEKLKSMGKDCKIDISWFKDEKQQEGVYARRKLELDYFPNVTYEVCTPDEKARLLWDRTFFHKGIARIIPTVRKVFIETDIYHSEILQFEDMYLQGYFACQKYYEDIMKILHERFQFPVKEGSENFLFAKEMQNCNSVSLHVRRGDYLDAVNREMFGNICTEKYYQAAIEYIQNHVNNPRFYVFSDDMDYVKETYQGEQFVPVQVNGGDDSYYDIYLMSQCRHNICANSTFSLWGGRLNDSQDSIKIRPLKHKNSQNPSAEEMREYWKNWVVFDACGGRIC